MNSLSSRLNFAFAISFVIGIILLLFVKSNFAYVTPFYAAIIGVPSLVILLLAFWGVSIISSPESRITASLLVILLVFLIPLGLFLGNKYPSNYYISPDGKIVFSIFPVDEYMGKPLRAVDDVVLKAYSWQNGDKKDASGKDRRFYLTKADGTIQIYDYPVVNQEVLLELDNKALDSFVSQQTQRAESFLKENDLAKAKEILSILQNLDPYADNVYRLIRGINQREKEEKEKIEREALEKAEAERIEAEKAEEEAATLAENILPEGEVESEPPVNTVEEPQIVKKAQIVNNRNTPKYRSNSTRSYNYSQPTPSYNSGYINNRQSSPTYYQQPQVVYAPAPVIPTRTPVPRAEIQQNRTYNPVPRQTVSRTPVTTQTNSETNKSEKKKKSIFKNPWFWVGVGAGAIVTEEGIRRNRKKN